VLLIVASRWRAFTSGSEGIPSLPAGPWPRSGLGHVAWVYMALTWRCSTGHRGLAGALALRLPAGRRARGRGRRPGARHSARRLKVIAVTASAALTSVCGTLWAQYVGFVDPFYVFSVDLSVRFALNAIIGGMGTALGPFLGSILITSLETYLRATLSGVKSGFTGST
jgi:branched-chain amino acid transport system permease protein